MSTENQDQEVVTKKKRTTKATATKTSETTPAAETKPTENENSESVAASDQTSTDGSDAEQSPVEGQQPEISSEQVSENSPAAETEPTENENSESVAASDQTSTDGLDAEQSPVEGQQPEISSEQVSEHSPAAETDVSVIETKVDEPKVQDSLEQSPVNLSQLPTLLNIQNDQKLEFSVPQSLSELELEVTNNGRLHTCLVSNAVLRPGETVVIKYKTVQLKRLAATNFNQLNALAGKQRFELKEG